MKTKPNYFISLQINKMSLKSKIFGIAALTLGGGVVTGMQSCTDKTEEAALKCLDKAEVLGYLEYDGAGIYLNRRDELLSNYPEGTTISYCDNNKGKYFEEAGARIIDTNGLTSIKLRFTQPNGDVCDYQFVLDDVNKTITKYALTK
jgi:hypothetical protein